MATSIQRNTYARLLDSETEKWLRKARFSKKVKDRTSGDRALEQNQRIFTIIENPFYVHRLSKVI